jgi:hypothetical protein
MAGWWGVGGDKIWCTTRGTSPREPALISSWSMYLLLHTTTFHPLLPTTFLTLLWLIPGLHKHCWQRSWIDRSTLNCLLESMFLKSSALFLLLGKQLVHAPSTKVRSAMFPTSGYVPHDGRWCYLSFILFNFLLFICLVCFWLIHFVLGYALFCISVSLKRKHTHTNTDFHFELCMCKPYFTNHSPHIESTVSRVSRKAVGVAVHYH